MELVCSLLCIENHVRVFKFYHEANTPFDSCWKTSWRRWIMMCTFACDWENPVRRITVLLLQMLMAKLSIDSPSLWLQAIQALSEWSFVALTAIFWSGFKLVMCSPECAHDSDSTPTITEFPTIYWSVPKDFWFVPIIYWYFPIGYQHNWTKKFWETTKKSWERTKKYGIPRKIDGNIPINRGKPCISQIPTSKSCSEAFGAVRSCSESSGVIHLINLECISIHF